MHLFRATARSNPKPRPGPCMTTRGNRTRSSRSPRTPSSPSTTSPTRTGSWLDTKRTLASCPPTTSRSRMAPPPPPNPNPPPPQPPPPPPRARQPCLLGLPSTIYPARRQLPNPPRPPSPVAPPARPRHWLAFWLPGLRLRLRRLPRRGLVPRSPCLQGRSTPRTAPMMRIPRHCRPGRGSSRHAR